MTTNNPHYISEEQAALNCAAGKHEWSLFGEGPAAYCLHCAATRRNVNAPIIPAPNDPPAVTLTGDDTFVANVKRRLDEFGKADAYEREYTAYANRTPMLEDIQGLMKLVDAQATELAALRAELAALKAERDGLKIELALVPTGVNNWNGDAFRVDPAVRDTPASNGTTELETRLNTDTPRTIDRSELGAALDLIQSGKVQPREGVDFVKMPAPRPPSKAVKLTEAGRTVLIHLRDGDKIYRHWSANFGNYVIRGGWGTKSVSAKTIERLGKDRLIRVTERRGDWRYVEIMDAGRAALRDADEEARKS